MPELLTYCQQIETNAIVEYKVSVFPRVGSGYPNTAPKFVLPSVNSLKYKAAITRRNDITPTTA
ncbi:MAG: hypothetical protein R3A12_19585 [Ignavibacteria bacterium]